MNINSGTDIYIQQLSMEINGGCNYACEMCPQSTGRNKDFLKKMPLDLFERVIDEAMDYGLKMVSLHGSGEPTLNNDMDAYVRVVKSRGLKCQSLTNGFNLNEDFSRRLIDSGIDHLRVSAIGYDRETYRVWMSKDAYQKVRDNVRTFIQLRDKMGADTVMNLYHAVLDPSKKEWEIEQYKINWIDYTGARAEIWMLHNWAGLYDNGPADRKTEQKRSCGRPFSPYLYVRAGGLGKHRGAVVPCCFVLGQDEKAVMGHLDEQSIAEVLKGDFFEHLCKCHKNNEYEELSYCKDCDQLFDAPESLAWTNIDNKQYGHAKYDSNLDFRDYAPTPEAKQSNNLSSKLQPI